MNPGTVIRLNTWREVRGRGRLYMLVAALWLLGMFLGQDVTSAFDLFTLSTLAPLLAVALAAGPPAGGDRFWRGLGGSPTLRWLSVAVPQLTALSLFALLPVHRLQADNLVGGPALLRDMHATPGAVLLALLSLWGAAAAGRSVAGRAGAFGGAAAAVALHVLLLVGAQHVHFWHPLGGLPIRSGLILGAALVGALLAERHLGVWGAGLEPARVAGVAALLLAAPVLGAWGLEYARPDLGAWHLQPGAWSPAGDRVAFAASWWAQDHDFAARPVLWSKVSGHRAGSLDALWAHGGPAGAMVEQLAGAEREPAAPRFAVTFADGFTTACPGSLHSPELTAWSDAGTALFAWSDGPARFFADPAISESGANSILVDPAGCHPIPLPIHVDAAAWWRGQPVVAGPGGPAHRLQVAVLPLSDGPLEALLPSDLVPYVHSSGVHVVGDALFVAGTVGHGKAATLHWTGQSWRELHRSYPWLRQSPSAVCANDQQAAPRCWDADGREIPLPGARVGDHALDPRHVVRGASVLQLDGDRRWTLPAEHGSWYPGSGRPSPAHLALDGDRLLRAGNGRVEVLRPD